MYDGNGDGEFSEIGTEFCHILGGPFCAGTFAGDCSLEETSGDLPYEVNPITWDITSVTSNVRIQWDEDISPDFTHGVSVKIYLQSKKAKKFTIKITGKEFIQLLPNFVHRIFKEVKLTFIKFTVKDLCSKFIPYTPIPQTIHDIVSSDLSCENNGTRSCSLDLSMEHPFCPASAAPSGQVEFRWEKKVGFGPFLTVGNLGENATIPNLSLTQSHTIRVTPIVTYHDDLLNQNITLYGEAFEKEFPAIQGNAFIYGPEDVYPNGSDVFGAYFELNGPVSSPVWSITPSELNDPYHFQVSPTGNSVVLFEPPIGGTATISVTGLNTVCNSTVILSKNICIHGIPNGPNNSSCSAGKGGNENIAGRAGGSSSGSEKPGFMHADSFLSAKTGTLDFDVFPNLVKAGGLTTIRPIAQAEDRKPVAVTVYDLLGRAVYSKANQDFSGLEPIQTDSFSPGMFLVEVTDGRNRAVKKIIVQ